jgi:queuine/archaeosine tRNA-ribosyltransferase
MNGKLLVTPTFFPAISSYGIKFPFGNLVYLLANYSYPRALVSAYDLSRAEKSERKKLLKIISTFKNKGFFFLDSGVYESFWKGDSKWSFDSYKNLASQVECDFYSSFDFLPVESGKKIDKEFEKRTFDNILASRGFSKKGALVPILHGSNPNHLISVLTKFVKTRPNLCKIIAIAERDCGMNVLEKTKTIVTIRGILDKNDRRNLLHMLGCGNPLSMLLFSYCGVDIFDSQDWAEHVINRDGLTINDFSQLELLNCSCRICSGAERNYAKKALLHNLLFYQDFVMQIQSLIKNNAISGFLSKRIDKKTMRKIESW